MTDAPITTDLKQYLVCANCPHPLYRHNQGEGEGPCCLVKGCTCACFLMPYIRMPISHRHSF